MTPASAGSPAALIGHGLHVLLPQRWEGRLYLRDVPGVAVPQAGQHPEAYGHPGESVNPVLHLANFALPPRRGDFGSGAVEVMGPTHAFVSLLEFDSVEAGRPLFADVGVPIPDVRDFAANQLQRRRPGQLGLQRFFTQSRRAFCVFVVLGSRRHAPRLVDEVGQVLAGLRIDVSSGLAS